MADAVRSTSSFTMRVSKRRLAFLAATFTTATVLNIALPAEAAPLPVTAAQTVEVQELEVAPASIVEPPRDEFQTVEFSLVTWPVGPASPISSGFGHRSAPCAGCSSNHDGVDFTPGLGTPIAALADGVVSEVGSFGGLGVHVSIVHVIDGAAYTSVYGHMLPGSATVGIGDTVTVGQQIGRVGDTGQSTGPHLHLELWDAADNRLDPYLWLTAHANS